MSIRKANFKTLIGSLQLKILLISTENQPFTNIK